MPGATTRNTGADFVYAELKRQIISLELKPGERVYEPAMASALQVSRTPLREAIRRLISESLLEQQRTGGVLVPALDEAAISELYEVRAAMESLMARNACLKATQADIDALEAILERNAAMVGFADEAMKQGMALHGKIAGIAGNSWARRFHDQISNQMERYRHFTNSTQEWLAASDDPEALASGGYWHHQHREKPHHAVRDERFQNELLDHLASVTGEHLR